MQKDNKINFQLINNITRLMILIKQRQKEKLFIIYVDDKSFFIHSIFLI